MNNIVLIGRLTRDPELRYIANTGTPVTNFTLAVDREFSKDGKKEVDFIDIQVWGKSAENCVNYIGKGSLVGVQGSLRIEQYVKDDEKRKATRVNANRVQFLDSKKKNSGQESEFDPSSLGTPSWNAIEDDDIPF